MKPAAATRAVPDGPGKLEEATRSPSPVSAIFALAWPVLCQQALVFLVGASDRFLAGRFEPDVKFQAAQTTALYLIWVITSYTVFITASSAALVARLVGAGDRPAAMRATNQALLLAAALGLVGTVAGLAGANRIAVLLGLHGETATYAADYFRPLFLLLAFQMIEMAGIYCLVGAGDTRPGLYVLGGVAVINIPLGWLFFYLRGFSGIALGTAVSNLIGCLVVLLMLARGRAGLWLRLDLLRPDWRLLWRLLRVGVPAGVDSMSIAVSQLWFLTIINGLGNVASGAHGIALGWESLAYLSGAAFGTASMALVGQNLGAGLPRQAARCGWTAYALGGLVMSAMGALFFALAPWMLALYCPQPEKHEVVVEGTQVLRLIAFAMPALACTQIFTGALRGAGDTRVPLLFTWTGFLLVRIPLAYLFTGPWFGLGLFGAWMAMFADLVVRGGFFLIRFAGGRWQRVTV
jgi:putative MATE family efflux protein